MDLTGQVAIVTGARRVGLSVAAELARRGAQVNLSCRRPLAAAPGALAPAAAARIRITLADLTDAGECRRLVAETASALGRLDILVNMASAYVARPFAELDEADWDRALAVDARAAYLCALAAAPHLRAAGRGRIVNVSDWVARSGRPRYPGYLPYYVAKSAVIALTEALALELAGDGILVNAVAPGRSGRPRKWTRRRCRRSSAQRRWGAGGAIRRSSRPSCRSSRRTSSRARRCAWTGAATCSERPARGRLPQSPPPVGAPAAAAASGRRCLRTKSSIIVWRCSSRSRPPSRCRERG